MKTLDKKLAAIRSGAYKPTDFIIADAKDGDIGFGAAAPGPDPDKPGRFKPRAAHLEAIREMTRSGLVDVMLLSASSAERLSEEGLFKKSKVTPAIRLNDTTDIWSARGGRYKEEPSRHHRTARVDQARKHVDLGLYSITFSNSRDIDAENAEAYSAFRAEAATHKMRHFLEVFNPAFDIRLADGADIGSFINDNIVRTLAGVMRDDHPHFLKLQYNGARAMEELAVLRPGAARRRHPRRRQGDDARHLRADLAGRAPRCARRAFRAQDQSRRRPDRSRHLHARRGGEGDRAGRGGEGLSRRAEEER